MADGNPIVGTIGLKIAVDVDLDVSSASTLELRYAKPDGTYGSFPGTYELNADGKHTVYYVTTAASDIDVAGKWTFQVYVESGANRFYGNQVKTEKFEEQLPTS